ncbi:MAG: DUF756 domain-containing protein, partial [Sphingomonas sp.]
LTVHNRSHIAQAITCRCAHGGTVQHLTIAPNGTGALPLPVAPEHRWYDLLVTADHGARQRLAGHVETGAPDISEPAPCFPHPA